MEPITTFKPNKLGIALLVAVPLTVLGFVAYRYFKKKRDEKSGKIGEEVVAFAKQFIDFKEIKPNAGFENSDFDTIMRTKGDFRKGAAWCAHFAKAVWCSVFTGDRLAKAMKLMNGSAVSTFNNLKADKSGYFEFSETEPKPGGLLFWGNPSQTGGHAAIYMGKDTSGQAFIFEGNWSDKVSLTRIRKNPQEKVFHDGNKNIINYTFLGYINIKE